MKNIFFVINAVITCFYGTLPYRRYLGHNFGLRQWADFKEQLRKTFGLVFFCYRTNLIKFVLVADSDAIRVFPLLKH